MYKKESLKKKRKRDRTDQKLEMDGELRDHSRVRYADRDVLGAGLEINLHRSSILGMYSVRVGYNLQVLFFNMVVFLPLISWFRLLGGINRLQGN
ncbi:uncharacterized protein ANIA_11662 [Aspergillus nidulans FGSC A4]|uniref:Uncharacterized protein n=1 Tax=Emericella nidulans (strain FGSC A4 / ATCC 38163 / CBS 112.46 / NRRL 194 / M139) TaxID=227321 RepID=C8V3S1_EMENI|nr:hypothetical protein [Aspergillus nidulans FGSC A4]CBF74304.1 TPA: hypothetical protein ANIA_11662 [Aspergillus nidulans FGSC A4]